MTESVDLYDDLLSNATEFLTPTLNERLDALERAGMVGEFKFRYPPSRRLEAKHGTKRGDMTPESLLALSPPPLLQSRLLLHLSPLTLEKDASLDAISQNQDSISVRQTTSPRSDSVHLDTMILPLFLAFCCGCAFNVYKKTSPTEPSFVKAFFNGLTIGSAIMSFGLMVEFFRARLGISLRLLLLVLCAFAATTSVFFGTLSTLRLPPISPCT